MPERAVVLIPSSPNLLREFRALTRIKVVGAVKTSTAIDRLRSFPIQLAASLIASRSEDVARCAKPSLGVTLGDIRSASDRVDLDQLVS